jgi:TIR domain
MTQKFRFALQSGRHIISDGLMSGNVSTKRKIFINYRRADNPDFVERIRDWFAWTYGRDSVFMDFDTIPPFTPFADFIRDKIHECDVLVAIIGPQWVNLLRERIEQGDDEDYVQLEIRLALEEGKPIAPICIKNAPPPRSRDLPPVLKPMLEYNIAMLDAGRDFLDNIEMLIDSLEQELSRLDGLKVINQDIEQTTFDVMEALRSSQEAAERSDWKMALDWLIRIRQSGYAPVWYPLEDYEAEAREGLRLQEAERNYNFIRQMAERALRGREDRERVWEALKAFWQKYPGYDPDDLASAFSPAHRVFAVSVESAAPEAEAAVDSAFDPAIFDHLRDIDESEADAMFDPDAVASLVEEMPLPDKAVTFEEAQALGLIDV